MLRLKLHCQFNDFNLILDQNIKSQQTIGLFGPSGSGKSKIIRQLVGLDQHQQKQAYIKLKQQLWQDSNQSFFYSTQQRGIGYLPQSIDLFPHLNVLNNITFGIKNQPAETTMLDEIISRLELGTLLNQQLEQLSGGQKQRVAIARALITAKELLLLDEPFSAIGEDHKPAIMRLIKKIQKEKQLTVIFSSHNRYEHAFLTDHLITIRSGTIDQSDSYKNISTDIKGSFCKMPDAINHIEAKVSHFEKQYSINQLTTKDHQLWAGNVELAVGSKVNCEIRAQDVSIFLTQNDHSSILNSFKVKVHDFAEITPHQLIIKLKFEETFIIAFITKKSFHHLKLSLGQNVFAKFKAVSILPISINNISNQ